MVQYLNGLAGTPAEGAARRPSTQITSHDSPTSLSGTAHRRPRGRAARRVLAWLAGAAIAPLLLLPPLVVVSPPEAAAQSGTPASVRAQIRRYGCHLPQYANSVAACRQLHARARTLAARGPNPSRARPSRVRARTLAPPPQSAPLGGLIGRLFGGVRPSGRAPRDSYYRRGRNWNYFFSPAQRTSATYRTLCVRLCDGYYWPISYATVRGRFGADSQRCESSCDVPAKLYVHRNPGGRIESMIDQEGNPYSALPNAFRYREEYVGDCRCKPDPWSDEAKEEYARRGETAVADAQPTEEEAVAVPHTPAHGWIPRSAQKRKATPRRRRLFDSLWPFSRWTNDG